MTSTSSQESPGPRRPSLLGSSAVMAAGTVVSRLTGFGRSAIIAAALGLTVATADVFNVPNVIPNMIYILVGGGILNSVLVPVLVKAIKNDADGGAAYSQRLFSLVVTVLAAATVLAVLAAPLIIRAIVDARYLEPEMRPYLDNMIMFARFCLPQIFFYGLYVMIGQILNAKGRFGPMMWAPILNNVVAIGVFALYLIVFGTKPVAAFEMSEMLLLGLGSTGGVAAQAFVLIPVLRATGFSLRFRSDWRGAGLGEPIRLGMWSVGFVIVNQIAYLFFVNVASGASAAAGEGDGAGYSVYANAMLIMMVPHAIITVSLATALLPHLADLATDGHLDQVRAKLTSAVRICLAIIVPIGALMVVLAYPLTALIFDYGSAEGQTGMLARTLIALIPGLLAFTVHYLCLRGFYALQDTRTPFFTQLWIAGVMVVWAVGITIIEPSRDVVTMTLATGYSAAYLVGAAISVVRLQREIGRVDFAPLIQHLVRLIIPTGTSAALAWFLWRGLSQVGLIDALPSFIARLIELAISATVGVATFVALAYAFRIIEVRQAVGMVLAKIRGGEQAPAEEARPSVPDEQLEETADHPAPFETGTLSIFRRPALNPDVTVEFFLDETMHGATMHGIPQVSGTAPDTGRSATGLGANPGQRSQRLLDVDTQPEPPEAFPGADATPPADRRNALAGRYHVQTLLDESAGVRSWYGFDEVLRRPVFIQVIHTDDPRAEAFVRAARKASTIDDPRFLRVLDIGTDGVSYLVREWAQGRSLARLLAEGPLHVDHASAVGREVAEALATAHAHSLSHRHLSPTLVFLTAEGSIKIAGLETEAVLHGPAEAQTDGTNPAAIDPQLLDAAGIGSVLYACLTARWPTGQPGGLEQAPWIDGRLASARQVRPGVPSALDAVTDRAVGNARRHHARPLRTPSEIATELGVGPRTDQFVIMSGSSGQAPGRPGTLADGARNPALVAEQPAPGRARSRRQQRRGGRLNRFLGVLGGALLLVGATLVGLQLMLSAFDTPEGDRDRAGSDASESPTDTSSPSPESNGDTVSLEPVAADYFDPFGSTPESPERVDDAIDGDTETAWTTLNYFDPLEDQKPGVGLHVDLGEVQALSDVEITLVNTGADLQIRVAPEDASDVPPDLDAWTQIYSEQDADQTVSHTLDQSVETRYLLVWFTRLPQDESGNYRSGIANVTAQGIEGGSD
ncbi:murein biosynthesis integral membrane protein MurJ [Actinobacteria bacterium YIM 96077]|uniref:Murein biosynthesis integral membrane protein MurJ n=1 Tax=Phytoactinopolyspora halophila TaxID=1981511 RepID=A0A329QRT6_9ACTN|nr:murein biosynthesis integral membrane protein MurJ [Phytoactinopolyspora halophila]AYY15099.1 murein biosynthesis integral membrane protein MurJ [Actinobacteria bacterium YIM 96077]RAW14721.1 murein biosynthesis integral membrane protein MurJ [Phytoactinopolyspora halophila]